jgi:sterol 22-desaturase
MVIPSFYNSLHDPKVFPEPDEFLPERWLDSEGPASKNPRNWLVFGSGPHRCIGNEYAQLNIALVLALTSTMYDWEHIITPQSNEVEYVVLIFLSSFH